MQKAKKTAKTTIKIASRNSRLARKIATRVGNQRLKKRFDQLTSESKVNQKTVLFCTFMGRSFSDSPYALYEQMITDPKFDDWTFIWAFKNKPLRTHQTRKDLVHEMICEKDLSNNSRLKNLHNQYSRMQMVKYGSQEYYEKLASSKYWITNSRLPEGIYPGKNNVCIQTWHGTPLKRLGADIENGDNALHGRDRIVQMYKEEAQKWDYLITQSAFNTEKMTSAFSIDSDIKILEEGYPRNDYLQSYSDKDVSFLKRKFNIPKDKKVLLYAPTWRDNQHDLKKGFTYKLGIDFEKLQKSLGDEWVVLFRAHYFIANKFDFSQFEGFVYDASKFDDINELYVVSDVLATDYSSVLFDYPVLQKPIIFFMYDKDEYENNLRGFYLSLDSLPGEIITQNEELIAVLNDFESYKKRTSQKLIDFKKEFCSKEDGKVSERIITDIFK